MCLIVFAYKQHPKFDLIFAANRDEFYQRPTRPAQFWEKYPTILAGKDCSAGGSWMGVNRQGEFAALTNYRDPSITRENPPSRGEIVINYLKQEKDSASFLKELHTKDRYLGFNVLVGSPTGILHYSNQEQKINTVEPGIHGLSNHLLNTSWPKVEQAKTDLSNLIKEETLTAESLFAILTNDTPAPDDQLPETGVGYELEKKISPIFIKTENYGTRSSTILLIDKQGKVTFEERRYEPGTTDVDNINRYEFEIEHG